MKTWGWTVQLGYSPDSAVNTVLGPGKNLTNNIFLQNETKTSTINLIFPFSLYIDVLCIFFFQVIWEIRQIQSVPMPDENGGIPEEIGKVIEKVHVDRKK